MLSGTNSRPTPNPWINPVHRNGPAPITGANPVIAAIVTATSDMPTIIIARGSTRPISRPTSSIPAIVPSPRGAIVSPAVTTG